MANIQASVNQGISLATLLATQSPAYKSAAEYRKLEKQANVIEKTIEAIPEEELAAKEPYGEQLAEIRKAQFEARPSESSFKAYEDIKPKKVAETEATPEEIAEELAMEDARKQEIEYWRQFYSTADDSLRDKQNALRETRRRNREIVYGPEPQYKQNNISEAERRKNWEAVYGSEND